MEKNKMREITEQELMELGTAIELYHEAGYNEVQESLDDARIVVFEGVSLDYPRNYVGNQILIAFKDGAVESWLFGMTGGFVCGDWGRLGDYNEK